MAQRRRYATRAELVDLITQDLGEAPVHPEDVLDVLDQRGVDFAALVQVTVDEPLPT